MIAAYFGLTEETDTFFLVYGFVLCLMIIMGHVFETVIVPHVTDATARGRNVDQLFGAILMRFTVVFGLLLFATMPAVRPLLSWATQLSPASLDLAVNLSLLMAPMPLLMAWSSALNGALNADKVFHVGALSPLYRSSTVILFTVLFYQRWGIYCLAWGYLLGELVRLLVSLRAFLCRGHRLEPTWTMSKASTAFFASAAYQTVGFGLLCFIPTINHITASWLEPGDLSIMSYALQLRNVPSLLFGAGLGTVVLSHWADHYSNSSARFSWQYVGPIFGILFLTAAVCAGCLIIFQRPIVSMALGWGAFPQERLPLVAQLFGLFVLSLPFDVATILSVRILIIVKADATCMYLSLLKVICLIALNCLMVRSYGLMGIGISLAATKVMYAGALFYCVTRQQTFQSTVTSALQPAGSDLPAPGEVLP